MNGVRLARNLSAAAVAGIAAWSSYSHMVGVALHYGERPEVAYVLPASVDGMLIVASVAMADDKRDGRKVRTSARIAFAAGVVASLAANVAHADGTLGARIVAAWPAIALLLVVEMLSRAGRIARTVQAVTAAQTAGDVSPSTAGDVTPAVVVAGGDVSAPGSSVTPQVKAPTQRRTTPKRQPSAADKVAAAVARSPRASDATIAGRTGLSEATVKRHRRQAVDSVSTPEPAPAPVLEPVAA
ncbi:DUF2637 domain-containing protein [Luedemannella helvata]|uniref:DUF2637 domain-containing protein n=1 Tax=Luedemannella helvata TaxID=349315 RepID=A0ABN2L847_9ACTN